MALTDPAYAKLKTLSQLANQLAYLKNQYTPDNKDYINAQAAKLRWQAVLLGFDLKVLEKEAVIKTGKDPDKIDWADFEKTTNAPFTAAITLANLKQQYIDGVASADYVHEQAQKLRMNAAYNGLDLTLIEQRAAQYVSPSHTEPNAAYLAASMPDIKEAQYAAELLKNAEYWQRIENDDSLTEGQKKWYQNQVHNESQNLRADALKDNLNLWEIEKLFTPSVTGHAWNNEDYYNAKEYIDKLYKAAGKDPSGVSVPNRATGGTKNDYTYKNPIVKRTTFGETYSGADMVVFFAFPGYKPIEIGVVTTVSITSYREKKQFRTVGRISARGITKGPRTISGKLIFTVIKEHVVETLKTTIPYLNDYSTLKFDELPSFDILISMGNEYGGSATLVINGVTSVDEQKTLSIEELFTENIFTYLARDYQPLREVAKSQWSKYDPQEWYSYKFREKGSELIGKFNIDDIILAENAKDLATALPAVGFNESWTKLSAADIAAMYYTTMPSDEQRLADSLAAMDKMPPALRGLFVQVLDDKGSAIRSGKMTVKFANGAYDGSMNPVTGQASSDVNDYTDNIAEFEFSKSKAVKSGDGKYYGLLMSEGNGYPGGLGFTVDFKGDAGNGKTWLVEGAKGTVDGSTMSPAFSVKAKLVDSSTVPKAPAIMDTIYPSKPEIGTYVFDTNVRNGYPNKVDIKRPLTEIYKSVNGLVNINVYVHRDGEPVKDATVSFTWTMYTDWIVSDMVENPKTALIDKKALDSLPATQYFRGTDSIKLTTGANGQINTQIGDLVFWKSTQTNPIEGRKEYLTFKQLPSGTIVVVYGKMVLDGKSHFIYWMVRKVSSANDA